MAMGMIRTFVLGLCAVTAVSWAQTRYKVDINAETPEGQLLQQIGQEQDPPKRIPLLEQFLSKHASHAAAPWVTGQLMLAAQKVNAHDKVLPAADKLIALDGADIEVAFAGLQAAVAKDDAPLIAKWAKIVVDTGKKASAAPEPKDEEEQERWKWRVATSKEDQAPKRAEYEVYMAGQRTKDLSVRESMLDTLAALNPKSEYVPQLRAMTFIGYRQAGQNDKALAFAAKAADTGVADEDMLLLLTYTAFEKKDQAAVVTNADRLADLLRTKAAPAGVDAATWDKKKNTTLGAGLWFKGMTLAAASKWKETDATLREALPLVDDNVDMKSHTLFNIAFANYKMGNAAEALNFNNQCAAVKGPKQAEAAKNAAVLRQQGAGSTPKKAGARKK